MKQNQTSIPIVLQQNTSFYHSYTEQIHYMHTPSYKIMKKISGTDCQTYCYDSMVEWVSA